MILMLFFHYLQNRLNVFKALSKEVGIWFLFFLSSFLSGIFIATDINQMMSSVLRDFQFYLVFIAVLMIADEEQSIDFFVTIYLIAALLSAITAIIAGEEYRRGRISIADLNPNRLGTMLSYGIVCALYLISLKKRLYLVLSITSILIFFYVLIQTGSRRPFIAASLLLALWLLFVLLDVLKNLSMIKRIAVIFALLLAGAFFYFYLLPIFNNSALSMRLAKLQEIEDSKRGDMYVHAMNYFRENPVFGLGYDQYRVVSIFKTYSHSTYGELLSTTGIIGIITYFPVYLIITYKLIKIIRTHIDVLIIQRAKIFLIAMAVMLFHATAMIHFYGVNSFVMFGIMIAFCNNSLKAREEQTGGYKTNHLFLHQKPT